MVEGTSTRQGETRTATRGTHSNVIRAEKRRVRQGYGLYVLESTGNSYFRWTGSDIIHEININNANEAPGASTRQIRASTSWTDHVSTQACGPCGSQESTSRASH
ncbi:uncharacterized protein LOC125314720 [Rhodamnia argentea]|uniref:Uncharacterized protein LOC125314720 n=1 Tax=Rhodamnia argentea TaxID=178133 RepID=A0ABM3HAI7_9MYRT|nr:uncharacterized protein LOC125314720 [Rhodamnia argentea]